MGAIKRLGLAAMLGALLAALTPSVRALECEGIPLRDGCLFTVTGGDTPDPDDGFAVTNAYDVPMWDFVKARDRDALGYPISQRWLDGPFTLQAFQKVILQWDPDKQRMNYYNTLDALANRYPEVELPFVPSHQILGEDQGATFGTIIRNHLALLDQNEAIKARFLAEPDWLNLYGLPIRYEEREIDGNPQGVQMLRTQRTVFVRWNVPAPGTTVGRVNLQNVPDKVKKLSNVVIPDRVERPLPAPNLQIAVAIHSLPWARTHVSPLEQEVMQRLETIARVDEPLFWYLLNDLDLGTYSFSIRDPVDHQPTQDTIKTYDAILDIANLSWVGDGLSQFESETVTSLYRSAFLWPVFVQALLQKPWFADGLSRHESYVIKWLHFMLENPGGQSREVNGELIPWNQTPERRRAAATVGADILAMPFLDTVDGFERRALVQLRYNYATDFNAFRAAVAHLTSKSWLTDAQALRLIYSGISSPVYSGGYLDSYISDIHTPELLDQYLAPENLGVYIYQQRISTTFSENLLLNIVSEFGVAPQTMTALEEVIREIEQTIGLAFPYESATIAMGTSFGTGFATDHVRFDVTEHFDVNRGVILSKTTRRLVNALLHYYFRGASSWMSAGATTFVQALVLNEPSIATGDWPWSCPKNSIVDIVGEFRPALSQCAFLLGADLFLDLHNSLGSGAFFEALRRLHLGMIQDEVEEEHTSGIRCSDCGEVEPGLYYVSRAFVTEAPPEVAAIAGPIIHHRYYVGDR